jgi:hypothetical protein
MVFVQQLEEYVLGGWVVLAEGSIEIEQQGLDGERKNHIRDPDQVPGDFKSCSQELATYPGKKCFIILEIIHDSAGADIKNCIFSDC